MKRYLPSYLIFILSFFSWQKTFCQNESTNWYFGNNAGIAFSSGAPIALSNGALNTHEGVASVSDTLGNLLFYTDGVSVYDASHAQMPNGTGLQGDPSSTQSAIIVKKPFSPSIYYIFTMADVTSTLGLRYSIVDMTLNAGLGAVISKNISVTGNTREKLTSVKHSNGIDYWILINDWSTDNIKAFLFDSSGINTTPIISSAGPIRYGASANALGYMKASRQNNKLAFGNWVKGEFIIVDFDNTTGMVDSTSRLLIGPVASYSYGVEFSPDGSKLYGTILSGINLLLQFDLSSANDSIIFNTCDTIAAENNFSCSAFRFGALQLGPDGKIYGVNVCDSSLLVINYPDQPAASCGFVLNGVSLAGRTCDLGLPNLISDQVLPGSISDISSETIFSIYPNPASEEINIQNLNFNNGNEIEIYSMLGEKIYFSNLKSKLTTIDISNFRKGVYIVEMKNASRKSFSTKKLVIK